MTLFSFPFLVQLKRLKRTCLSSHGEALACNIFETGDIYSPPSSHLKVGISNYALIRKLNSYNWKLELQLKFELYPNCLCFVKPHVIVMIGYTRNAVNIMYLFLIVQYTFKVELLWYHYLLSISPEIFTAHVPYPIYMFVN